MHPSKILLAILISLSFHQPVLTINRRHVLRKFDKISAGCIKSESSDHGRYPSPVALSPPSRHAHACAPGGHVDRVELVCACLSLLL